MKIQLSDALVVVDVQRDFCLGGALPVPEGDAVVPVINSLIPKFNTVVFTRDWHPVNHCSFDDVPKFSDNSWPPHCVAGSPGAAFHEALHVPKHAIIVNKATKVDADTYSGFVGTSLAEKLRDRNITRIYVCGLATDYCVKFTALDGAREGFDVLLIEDACRGVDIPPGAVMQALDALRAAGITVVHEEDIE